MDGLEVGDLVAAPPGFWGSGLVVVGGSCPSRLLRFQQSVCGADVGMPYRAGKWEGPGGARGRGRWR